MNAEDISRLSVEALADAWASQDGKLAEFRAGKGKPIDEQPGAHYDGYIADAESMMERLARRGYVVVPSVDPRTNNYLNEPAD